MNSVSFACACLCPLHLASVFMSFLLVTQPSNDEVLLQHSQVRSLMFTCAGLGLVCLPARRAVVAPCCHLPSLLVILPVFVLVGFARQCAGVRGFSGCSLAGRSLSPLALTTSVHLALLDHAFACPPSFSGCDVRRRLRRRIQLLRLEPRRCVAVPMGNFLSVYGGCLYPVTLWLFFRRWQGTWWLDLLMSLCPRRSAAISLPCLPVPSVCCVECLLVCWCFFCWVSC